MYVIQVTDRDGVPLLRVSQEKNVDFGSMPSVINTFTMSSDQAGKLGIGRNKTVIAMYTNYQVKHSSPAITFLYSFLSR